MLSLEEGVRKVTALPAPPVGMLERGSFEVGNYADLVLFDPDTVADRATPAAPHVPSVGIETVWVNGLVVFDAGKTTGNRPGQPIRRTDF